jgi:hypothetical protein
MLPNNMAKATGTQYSEAFTRLDKVAQLKFVQFEERFGKNRANRDVRS